MGLRKRISDIFQELSKARMVGEVNNTRRLGEKKKKTEKYPPKEEEKRREVWELYGNWIRCAKSYEFALLGCYEPQRLS